MAEAGPSSLTPEGLVRLSWDFGPPLVFEAAISIGLFEALEPGPLSLPQLAQATNASERGIRTLVRALEALGAVRRTSSGEVELTTEIIGLMRSHRDLLLNGPLRTVSARAAPWLKLAAAVQTGEPVTALDGPEGAKRYKQSVRTLFSLNVGAAQSLAWMLRLRHVTAPHRVLDIGTGSGVWGITLAKASRFVEVTAIDWEDVLDVTREMAQRHGVAAQMKFVGGDFHTIDLGESYDVAILGHVVHSEGRLHSVRLLEAVWRALKPGGTIALADFFIGNEGRPSLIATLCGASMLVNTRDGDVVTVAECMRWLRDCGFANPTHIPLGGPASLIRATRP